MIMSILMRDRFMPLMAPIGAAAYVERDTPSGAELLFAMMKKGETGADALRRLRNEYADINWIPVSERPERQLNGGESDGEFKKFEFTYKDGSFTGKTEAMQGYLDAITRLQQLPSRAPDELTATMANWLGKVNATPGK